MYTMTDNAINKSKMFAVCQSINPVEGEIVFISEFIYV